jgi:hypothetical protein
VNGSPDFLADVAQHLKQFASANNVAVNEVIGVVTLADGSFWRIRNLREAAALGAARWGMIVDENKAVVVRESHVVKVEFRLASDNPSPIGFHAETNE